MKWELVSSQKETDHRFLNFYSLSYKVGDKSYSYFLASRHEKEAELRPFSREFARPDGVIIALYRNTPKGKEVLLCRQFRPALNSYVIEFPAGLLEPSDPSEMEAAKREAEEESGAKIKNIELIAPSSPTSTGLSDECCSVVLAEVEALGESHLEEFEDIDSSFVSLEKLAEILDDPKCLIALNVRLLALLLLQRWAK